MQATHGVESMLEALPPNRLRKLHLEFLDLHRIALIDTQVDPTATNGNGGVNLSKFTDLDTLIIQCRPMIEDVNRLHETLASWKPMRVSSRTLTLYTTMRGVWEGLWEGGDHEMSRRYADVVEETSTGPFSPSIHDVLILGVTNIYIM